ncbi:hypothetical protein TIFTF001_005911 [Ficus carica]|uniref:Protein kinase domain-containing protein n=1 Tax=Ficus carica TaxID=3494 RepID=A0AA87ZPZ2_FICCA|nr:hypothetical protein TIFTF001_005911 [Ficus carica]
MLTFRKKDDKKETFFLKNGGAVLEQLIRCFNGDCNPIRSFSTQELRKATNNFEWVMHEDDNYSMYEGIHENREISVKKFKPDKDDEVLGRIANEAAIASRMSNHKNVLKLVGCCLETELPLLVYEFPTMGSLENHIYVSENNQLPWEDKLKIAIGLANAVAYLHHGLSKTIIHRDIKPTSIFLDQNLVAKLFDFQDALQIPEGEAHIDAEVVGTFRFVAPEIAEKGRYVERSDSDLTTIVDDGPKFDRLTSSDGRYTEKSDVYSFGVLLLEILTGKRLNNFIFCHSGISRDFIIWHSGISHERISSFSSLESCISSSSGQLREFYTEMLQERFDISLQEGENREQECSSVQSDEIIQEEGENREQECSSVQSDEIIQEHCDGYAQEENRMPINSNFQIQEMYASIFKEYSKIHPQEENGAQKMEYVKLVQRCLKENPDDRPNMIECFTFKWNNGLCPCHPLLQPPSHRNCHKALFTERRCSLYGSTAPVVGFRALAVSSALLLFGFTGISVDNHVLKLQEIREVH